MLRLSLAHALVVTPLAPLEDMPFKGLLDEPCWIIDGIQLTGNTYTLVARLEQQIWMAKGTY